MSEVNGVFCNRDLPSTYLKGSTKSKIITYNVVGVCWTTLFLIADVRDFIRQSMALGVGLNYFLIFLAFIFFIALSQVS